jgi:polyisoprenoid-binding protein YceI
MNPYRHLIVPGLLAISGFLAAMPQASAAPTRYQLDPDHISMGFLVDHLGYAKVLGMFRAVRGSYSFDEDTGALSDVRIEVDTKSVFSAWSSPLAARARRATAASKLPASSNCWGAASR